jgi:periplasmic protein TonB
MKIVRAVAVVVLLAGFLRGFVLQNQAASPTSTPAPSPTPSGPATPKKIRVSSGVAEGLRVRYVPPEYPQEAREKHISGDVFLQVTIDRQGNSTNIRAVSGDPILVKSAIKAVSQWKYRPYVLNGEAVEVETAVTIKYHM